MQITVIKSFLLNRLLQQSQQVEFCDINHNATTKEGRKYIEAKGSNVWVHCVQQSFDILLGLSLQENTYMIYSALCLAIYYVIWEHEGSSQQWHLFVNCSELWNPNKNYNRYVQSHIHPYMHRDTWYDSKFFSGKFFLV